VSLNRIAVVVKPWVTPAVGSRALLYFVPSAAQLLTIRGGDALPGEVAVQDAWYGRFLPSHWVEYRELRLTATAPVPLPDGSQRTYAATMLRSEELATATPSPEPLVTPPLAPLIRVGAELVSAFEPRTGVGTGPLLAWSPPATGAPTSYTVLLLSPMADPNSFLVEGMALTSRTSFRFPDGTLTRGSSYFAVISARSAERESLDAPLRMQFDADLAQVVTAGFTP
jgi:hypothetical protein